MKGFGIWTMITKFSKNILYLARNVAFIVVTNAITDVTLHPGPILDIEGMVAFLGQIF